MSEAIDRLIDTDEREAPDVPTRFTPEHLQERALRNAALLAEERPADDAAPADPEAREAAEARGYLYSLGFEDAALSACRERIPEEWRGALAAYTGDLAAYVRHGQGPYLGAATGRGKTCGLALIALAAQKADLRCAYVLCGADLVWACEQRDRMAQARASRFDFDGAFDPDAKPWPYMDMDLLLLDDLDLLRGTGFDPEREGWDTVSRFLYARMARGLATAIASNLPFQSVTADGVAVPLDRPTPPGGVVGLTHKPGMARVASRWQERIPPALRLMTGRGDQRDAGRDDRPAGADGERCDDGR